MSPNAIFWAIIGGLVFTLVCVGIRAWFRAWLERQPGGGRGIW